MYKKSSLKTQDKSKGMKVREDCVMKEVATRANEACSCWKPWTLVESTHLGVLYSWGQGPKLFIQQIPLSISHGSFWRAFTPDNIYRKHCTYIMNTCMQIETHSHTYICIYSLLIITQNMCCNCSLLYILWRPGISSLFIAISPMRKEWLEQIDIKKGCLINEWITIFLEVVHIIYCLQIWITILVVYTIWMDGKNMFEIPKMHILFF